MKSGGVAAIGVGTSEADPEHRAEEAIYRALNHPLLEVDYSGAAGALIQVIGGNDLTLEEVSKIGEIVGSQLDPSAQTIWGARILPEMEGKLQVISIVTGVKSPYILGAGVSPEPRSVEKALERHVDSRSSLKRPISNDLGIDIIS